MRQWESVRKLTVTQYLRFNNRKASLQVEMGDGSVREVYARDLSSQAHAVVTAAKTLGQADNGGVFYLDAAAGFAVTLPAPFLGGSYEFIVKTAPTSNGYDIATNGGADILIGLGWESEVDTTEDGPTDQNADNLNMAANIAVAGDFIRVKSDGTNWYWESGTAADGGVVPSTT